MANLVTPADIKGIERPNSFNAYQRAEEEFNMKKQLAAMEMAQTQAAIQKAQQLDADKIGEQAFLKAAQGLPITPQEEAALRYIDAKQPTAVFNPVTGVMEQKPSLLNRAGVSIGQLALPAATPLPQSQPAPIASTNPQKMTDLEAAGILDLYGEQPQNPAQINWIAERDKQLAEAKGNPKLQQSIMTEFAKSQLEPTEAQAKAAGFSDRMLSSEQAIQAYTPEGMDIEQKAKAATPLIGNFLVTPEYQQFNQAQRDFINAQLRRESGAVISDEEFANARQQYFPQPGDDQATIERKRINRENAIRSMAFSAGASYRPTEPKKITRGISSKDRAESIFNAKKAARSANDAQKQVIRQRLQDAGIDPKEAGL